jgi:hypothetical protein
MSHWHRPLPFAAALAAIFLIPGLAAASPLAQARPAQPAAPERTAGAAAPAGTPGCDPIGAVACLLPFPDDYYTVRDPQTATGRRVNFTAAMMPANVKGVPIDPAEWDRNDGFSPGTPILTVVPGIDLGQTGAAPVTNIGAALRRDAPIVIIDTRTGRRWPYWAELDSNTTDTARQALIVRPALRLAEGTHYVVALRNLRNSAGRQIPPGPAFAAMLANHPPAGGPVLRARWFSMRRVLRELRRHGVGTNGLYLAWDFTTSSTRSLTERVLHMRDQAFAELGGHAPGAVITSVTDYTQAQNPFAARKVDGYVNVPSYLSQPGGPPGSRLHYASPTPGPGALPEQIPGNVQQALFECVIPWAAATRPARLALFGHGLFGDQTSVSAANAEQAAQEADTIFCGAAWIGMSSGDLPFLISESQDLSGFPAVPDRMQQAYLDFLFLGREMTHPDGLRALPAFQGPGGRPLISAHPHFGYVGYSLGGIQGTALAALAQDYTRAVLGVPAVDFSTLLNRSVDFVPFGQLLTASYPDKLTQQAGLALMQMLWDRGEGDGYVAHVTSDPLERTPVKRVLLHMAFGDHQVANVATEVEARDLGLHVYQPALAPGRSPDVVPLWGIPAIGHFPFSGSALMMWDSGSPPPPLGNVPPTAGHDPHTDTANTPAARQQAAEFLLTGQVTDVCGGLPCVAIPSG